MTHLYKKTFPIENAENFRCSLVEYYLGHSQLYIRVMHEGEFQFCLYVADVKYISCPTRWTGANFELGSVEECKKILASIDLYFPEDDEYLHSIPPNLFVVKTDKLTVQIVAHDIEKLATDCL